MPGISGLEPVDEPPPPSVWRRNLQRTLRRRCWVPVPEGQSAEFLKKWAAVLGRLDQSSQTVNQASIRTTMIHRLLSEQLGSAYTTYDEELAPPLD